jgi:hypothetical protein
VFVTLAMLAIIAVGCVIARAARAEVVSLAAVATPGRLPEPRYEKVTGIAPRPGLRRVNASIAATSSPSPASDLLHRTTCAF